VQGYYSVGQQGALNDIQTNAQKSDTFSPVTGATAVRKKKPRIGGSARTQGWVSASKLKHQARPVLIGCERAMNGGKASLSWDLPLKPRNGPVNVNALVFGIDFLHGSKRANLNTRRALTQHSFDRDTVAGSNVIAQSGLCGLLDIAPAEAPIASANR
jgi:hypothetical protein